MYSPCRISVSSRLSARSRSRRPRASTSTKMVETLESGTSIARSRAPIRLARSGVQPQLIDFRRDPHRVRHPATPPAAPLRPGPARRPAALANSDGQATRLRGGVARELDLGRDRGVELADALELGLVLAFQFVAGDLQHQHHARSGSLQVVRKESGWVRGHSARQRGLGIGDPDQARARTARANWRRPQRRSAKSPGDRSLPGPGPDPRRTRSRLPGARRQSIRR